MIGSMNRIVAEAMTADQITAAQSEHYMLDDQIRRSSGRLTIEQKRKVFEYISKLIGDETN